MAEIKRWDTGKIIHALPGLATIKDVLEDGVRVGIDFYRADLNNAKLNWAELNNAKLNWAELNNAKLNGADLNNAKLNWAELNWAELNNAKLNNAELNGADLNWAELNNAELNGADLNWAELNGTGVLIVLGLYWPIIITPTHLKIGCERHTRKEWGDFGDDRIAGMDSYALEWWRGHKDLVLSIYDKAQEDKEAWLAQNKK